MTKFRQHRRSLDESMATVIEIADRATLEMYLVELFRPWIDARDTIDWSTLKIAPYDTDIRTGWNTHIVTVMGQGVLGMTDGPL